MTKQEIIEKLRSMAKYPTVTLPRDSESLRKAADLLEEQDEPVAWMYWQSCLNDDGTQTSPWVQRYSKFKPTESVINKDITPLYITPQRTWVGLTDEDMGFLFPHGKSVWVQEIVKIIENKLKEKNGFN